MTKLAIKAIELIPGIIIGLASLIAIGYTPIVNSHRSVLNNDAVRQSFAGQSLFDDLFLINHTQDLVQNQAENQTGTSQYEIPYPFQNLVSSLEDSMGISINNDGNQVRSVLIPLGRCINRYAGGPDYFKHPRVVVGVDSEHHGDGEERFPNLKDRLFIGYQEAINAMEVISYNEDAGRFEFQVVTNYKPGQTPVVEYVDRSLCTGCHQNNGPIFSVPPWDETNNNQKIYQKLAREVYSNKSEIPPFSGSGASHLDGASNRANLFSLYQEFWRGICQGDNSHDITRCRAGIFEMALLHRLQENNRNLVVSDRVNNYLNPTLARDINQQWPHGISILSSDIKNQDPESNGEHLHLAKANELLYPRTLLIKWNPDNLLRVLEGLGKFISLSNLKRIDSKIYQLAISSNSPRSEYTGQCRLKFINSGWDLDNYPGQSGELSVNCDLAAGVFSKTHHFFGDFYVNSGKIESYPVSGRMVLDSPGTLTGLSYEAGKIESQDDDWIVKINPLDSKRQFHARLPDGNIIEKIEIRWPKSGTVDDMFIQSKVVDGSAVLYMLPGSDILDTAISGMVDQADQNKTDVFTEKPFRTRKLMTALIEQLD